MRGSLSALATGRDRDGGVLAGQVAWLLTGDHWTGLRPVPGSGARQVRLEPVERADFRRGGRRTWRPCSKRAVPDDGGVCVIRDY
ncbi:hypothetical protein [Actinoplanes sp. DH11]|uniref:hypothetical protein n=1 Tax=Actinoplanes sp. DH11 TaxID=2857011 RepID=UPI001E4F617D|nr:hypothetical protein [Actinoplanes sp. DH11]